MRLHAAIDAAFAAVERVQELMSYHDPASELSRINRDAACTEQRIDAQTYAVLEVALRMAALSNGAFDPCIGEHLERWGYLPSPPPLRLRRACPAGHGGTLQLIDSDRVRFARPLRLDLGGIAKGYAVDCAVHALQRTRESRRSWSTPAAIFGSRAPGSSAYGCVIHRPRTSLPRC